MEDWLDYEFDKTVRDFEYTKRSVQNMYRVLDSSDFVNKDAETIFDFLTKNVDLISFGDYLRRYLFEKAEIQEPFSKVDMDVYLEILEDCFRENHVPISFKQSSRRRKFVLQSWLTQDTVKRESVFLLGFALKMSAEDVSSFLVKVLKDEDFDMTDANESIYWYCYKNELPFLIGEEMKQEYENLTAEMVIPEKSWTEMITSPSCFLADEENFKKHLTYIKAHGLEGKRQDLVFEEYMKLYDRCRVIIADIFNTTGKFSKNDWTKDDIAPNDLEEILCAGMPRAKNGNLERITSSQLAKKFSQKRMNRQRVQSILNRSRKVQRFDFITLLFFVYAETIEKEWPVERFLQYVDEVNKLLKKCNMMGIYCANPYEMFVLMCLLTDGPLESYAEVWERSY